LGFIHAVNSTYLEKQSTFIYILYYFFKHTSSWAVYYITKNKDFSMHVLYRYLSGKGFLYLFALWLLLTHNSLNQMILTYITILMMILRRSYSKWKGLKGQKSQYFRPSVFFIKQYPLVLWFTGKSLFEFCFEFADIRSIFGPKNRACGVNVTASTQIFVR
jgi:hypothetical protein